MFHNYSKIVEDKNTWVESGILPEKPGKYWATVINHKNMTLSVKPVCFSEDGEFLGEDYNALEEDDIIMAWMEQERPRVYAPFFVYAYHFDGSFKKVVMVDTVKDLHEVCFFEERCAFPEPMVLAIVKKETIRDKILEGNAKRCYVLDIECPENLPQKIDPQMLDGYKNVKFGYLYKKEDLDIMFDMEKRFLAGNIFNDAP